MDGVASALRLRRAPVLPLFSSSDQATRSRIRCAVSRIMHASAVAPLGTHTMKRGALPLPRNPSPPQTIPVEREPAQRAVVGPHHHVRLAGGLARRGPPRLRLLRVSRRLSGCGWRASSIPPSPHFSHWVGSLSHNSSSSTRASLVCDASHCTFERHRGQHARTAASLAAAQHRGNGGSSSSSGYSHTLKRAAAGLPPQAAVERVVFPRELLVGAQPTRTRNGEAVDFE